MERIKVKNEETENFPISIPHATGRTRKHHETTKTGIKLV